MKYRLFIFIFTIISFFLISTNIYALPALELCTDQKDYAKKKYEELYCIKCDKNYPRELFYAELKEHFTETEIVELGLWCAENVGAGSFVRTLNIITWEQACELNPQTAANAEKASFTS